MSQSILSKAQAQITYALLSGIYQFIDKSIFLQYNQITLSEASGYTNQIDTYHYKIVSKSDKSIIFDNGKYNLN